MIDRHEVGIVPVEGGTVTGKDDAVVMDAPGGSVAIGLTGRGIAVLVDAPGARSLEIGLTGTIVEIGPSGRSIAANRRFARDLVKIGLTGGDVVAIDARQ